MGKEMYQVYRNEKTNQLFIISAIVENGQGMTAYCKPKDDCLFEGTLQDCTDFVKDFPKERKKVYLSGAVTGLQKIEYKTNFNNAELYLTGLGYNVINPTSYDEIPNGTWEDYMKRDIKLLCDCDYIYMLHGWEKSKGAKTELYIANQLKIPVLELD